MPTETPTRETHQQAETDRDRYRAALQAIVDQPAQTPWPVIRGIARDALEVRPSIEPAMAARARYCTDCHQLHVMNPPLCPKRRTTS